MHNMHVLAASSTLGFSFHHHPSTCTLLLPCALCVASQSWTCRLLHCASLNPAFWTSASLGLFVSALTPPSCTGLFFVFPFFCFAGLTWRDTRLARPSVCRAAPPFSLFFLFRWSDLEEDSLCRLTVVPALSGSSVCRVCTFLFSSSFPAPFQVDCCPC